MRQLVRDEASQPVTNFARDPRGTKFIGNQGIGFSNTRWAGDTSYSLLTGIVGPQGTDLTTAVRGTCVNIRAGLGFDLGSNPESGTPGGQLLPVTPGKRYSVEVWFQSSVARDAVTAIRFVNGSAWSSAPAVVGNQVALAAGTWSLLTVTGIAPADATHMSMYAKYTNNAVALNPGDYFMGTGLFVHEGAPILRHADGNSPGWKWTGTPNASESVGYSWAQDAKIIRQEIINRHSNPTLTDAGRRGWAGNDSNLYTTSAVSTGGVNGGSCFQLVRTANSPSGTAASYYSHGYPDAGGLLQIKVQPGEILQGSWAVKPGADGRRTTVYLTFRNTSGTQVAQLGATTTVIPANNFTRVFTQTVTVPAGADSVLMGGTVTVTDVGSTVPANEVTLIDQAFIGPPHDYYADGDVPGWRWLGTAGLSPSTGFPYTLEQIAGKPLASVTAPGTQSAPLDLAPTEGRTLYVVHDFLALNADTNSVATIGTPDASSSSGINSFSGGEGAISIRTNGLNNHYVARAQSVGGASPALAVLAGGTRSAGMHVSVLSVPDGLATATLATDSSAHVSAAIPPGSGLNANPKLGLSAVSLAERPIHALAYRGQHDLVTERRIVAWLARQYGAPIPTGY